MGYRQFPRRLWPLHWEYPTILASRRFLKMASKARKGAEAADVSQSDVLAKAFSRENVTFTLTRMASARDKDNLIAHPLRAAILIEFQEELSEMISRQVISGLWSPS